ncbi:L-2-amino-thiazoline-4-carboxylic acid hydrolase [bacterium]|nr:L-2-amino-thiazoline-4-carboxylic acid hydrolase [bacterium]MBU1637276.1 L-2-amino-thiazoline-4-carboxylic acid hydrolase [bacterium]
MIALPAGISIDMPPIEVGCPRTVRSLLGRVRDLYEAIYDRYGLEGLDLINSVSREHGMKIANRARGDGPPWTIQQIGDLIIRIYSNINTDGSVEDYGSDRITIRVNQCPYPLRTCALCCAHTSMEQALVEALNPDYEFIIEKSIPANDPYCLHVLKPK